MSTLWPTTNLASFKSTETLSKSYQNSVPWRLPLRIIRLRQTMADTRRTCLLAAAQSNHQHGMSRMTLSQACLMERRNSLTMVQEPALESKQEMLVVSGQVLHLRDGVPLVTRQSHQITRRKATL